MKGGCGRFSVRWRTGLQVQHELEDAEERADVAENTLTKVRAKSKQGLGASGMSFYSTTTTITREEESEKHDTAE